MNPKAKLISIVAPFYNEAEVIESFHSKICDVIDAISDSSFEIICVDDGSSDDTLSRLIALIERNPRVRVIELSRNFGKELALTAGLDASNGDAVIPIDADLQDPPDLIPVLLREWQNGAEVVLARRKDRRSDSFFKRRTASLFYSIHNWLSPVKIPKNVGDFRLIDRAVIETLKKLPERQRFMKGLFAWVGFKTVTVDYARSPRRFGQPKFSPLKLWNLALEGFTSFSTVPLKLCTVLGSIIGLASVCYSGFIVLRTLLIGVDIPGYASLLVAVLFLGSLQLIGIGLLGEYVGRIYMETKQRPLYVVRKQYHATDL